MNRRLRDYLLLLLITTILWLIYIYGRSVIAPFVGADSYYFLNHIFHNTPLLVTDGIGSFIINLLPHSILGIKLIMWFITSITLFIAYEVGRLYSKKNALIYSIALISMFTFSMVFFKLEDDFFALPFLFTSLYFIVKYQLSNIKKKWFDKNIILSLGFLFISVLIWNYTVLFILMYLFITNYHRLYILASGTFIVFFHKFISTIIPNFGIAENKMAFVGMNIAGGIIILLFFLYLKKSMIKQNKIGIIVFSVFTLLNFKMIYILIPILFLNNIKLLKTLPNANKLVIYFIYLLFLLGTLNQIIILPPTTQDYKLTDVAQTYSKLLNKQIEYPWGLGYFYMYNKISGIKYFGTIPDTKISYDQKIVIINKGNPQVKSCELLDSSKWYEVVNCP